MPANLALCPGSRTISAATHLLSLQGDLSDDQVIDIALGATSEVSILPRFAIWYDLVAKVVEVSTMGAQ